jgi:hypothetical protein
MRSTLIFILLSLLATGCSSRDAKLREKIVGIWPIPPSGSLTFLSDGSFHFRNEYVTTNTTLKWVSDGIWDVKDGFLNSTITNSIAENTTEKPSVGDVMHSKINFVDEHNLSYGTEKDVHSYHR